MRAADLGPMSSEDVTQQIQGVVSSVATDVKVLYGTTRVS